MFIQTESTPNPATLKFLPGETVMQVGTADFPSSEAGQSSPLARRIFGVDGVTGVFFGPDFVTVTKDDGVMWDHIKPGILGSIMEHFQSGLPVLEGESGAVGHAAHDGPDAPVRSRLRAKWVPRMPHGCRMGAVRDHLLCSALVGCGAA